LPTPPLKIDERYLDYATPRQREILEAVIATGSATAADAMLKIAKGSASDTYKSVKSRATHRGFSPDHDMTRTVPEGYKVKGVSTYYDRDGKAAGQWVKSGIDEAARLKSIEKMVKALTEDLKGLAPFVPEPAFVDSDLMAVYPIGDHHHGMYSDANETGADYDCKIAAGLLEGAVDRLCASAPPTEDALLLNLGDYYHANDSSDATPASNNKLDVDTRYGRVMHSGAMALVRCTLRLLEKHKRVIVWNMRGNHDPDAAFALAMAMSFYFHDEPRVTVDMGVSLYKFHRFGKNLIASHHGHGAKGPDLPLLMAVDRPEDWAATTHRVWHCGHIHHKTLKEHPGVDVETHRTLAASDAWHAGKGYRSKRDMSVIVYHRDYGEVQRTRFDLEMLRAA
jgi:hypothetical protein